MSMTWDTPVKAEKINPMAAAPRGVNLVFWWKGYRFMDPLKMSLVGQLKALSDGFERVVCESGTPYDAVAFEGWQELMPEQDWENGWEGYMANALEKAGKSATIVPTPDTPPGFTGTIWTNPTGQEVFTMYAPGREPVHVLKDECPRYLLAAYGHVVTGTNAASKSANRTA